MSSEKKIEAGDEFTFGGTVIHPDSYVLGQWFTGDEERDVLMMVWREPGGAFQMQGRTRIHVDDKVFDSEDLKQWFTGTLKRDMTEEEVLAGQRKGMQAMAIKLGMKSYDEILVRGTLGDLLAALQASKKGYIYTAKDEEARSVIDAGKDQR